MKKIVMILMLAMVVLVSVTSVFSQQLIDFDKNKRVCYFSEDAWYSLPMTGPTGKIDLLKSLNLPPGWEVRGMYTNKLFAVVKSNGDIDFK